MRVVTWNINSIRARAERVGAWIDLHRPEVLCFQETRCVDDEFPRELFSERGYTVEVFGQPGRNGVAIAASEGYVIEDVVRGFPDDDDNADKRVIAATVGGLRLVDVYVVNGQEVGSEKYDYKLSWLSRLKTFLETQVSGYDDPVVCLGDFNVAPEDRDVWAADRYRHRIMFSDPEIVAWRALLEVGLADLHRTFTEDAGVFTWWDYRRLGFPKNQGWRIDHFLAAPAAVERATGVEVDREERKGKQPSDHAPVIATFAG